MQATTDTVYWPKLAPMASGFDGVTWAAPDGRAWEKHDVEDLLQAIPVGTVGAVWSYGTPLPEDNRVASLKRSFRGNFQLHKARAYSRDLDIRGKMVWFDLAILNMKCADDVVDMMGSGLGMTSSLLLLNATDDPAIVGELIADVLEDVWNRIAGVKQQMQQHRGGPTNYVPWLDVERSRLVRGVPGHLFVAMDSDATRYLLGTAASTAQWLTAASRSRLDLDKVWHNGVDLIEPGMTA